MPLDAGTRFGAYEILAPLGAGGMGEVYRARDTKLGREVAIKVLPDLFAHDEKKLARFRREAHLLASLNHPNIATLYGVEQSEDQQLLVMELVEGETLAERIVRGPIPVEEALPVFKEIAEGLEAAHEKSVIHRDLKPANIKITPNGTPKILDFGLAKAGHTKDASDESPTITRQGTETGVILGTAAYMSPEQARGKTLDKRTDIWSFGCCLYEALTGKAAFLEATVSDTIASILKNEPDWAALPATTPMSIRGILRRSLRKDARTRVHDIADARIEIEESLAEPLAPVALTTESTPQESWAFVKWIVLGALIGGLLVGNVKPTTPHLFGRYDIQLSAGLTQYRVGSIAISPDGDRVVYAAARKGGRQQLFVREADSFESIPLPGTQGARGPCFSPGGEWVAYGDGGTLKKVAVRGGPPIVVGELRPAFNGCAWVSDEVIVFSSYGDGLLEVSSQGGSPVSIARPNGEADRRTLKHPQILPDGDSILYSEAGFDISSYDDARVAVVSRKTGQVKVLLEGGSHPRYMPTGHIVYGRAGSLMTVVFDLDRLEVIGAPLPVVQGVVTSPSYGSAQFAISNTGTLVYVPGAATEDLSRIVWVDRKGGVEPLPLEPRPFLQPRLSPDGRRIAVRVDGANSHIWIYDVLLGSFTRFTYEGSNEDPVWSPDGLWIAFSSERREGSGAYRKPGEAGGSPERLSEDASDIKSWSPDGRRLTLNPRSDVSILSLEAESEPEPFLRTRFQEDQAMFSPDGHWVAYESDESGRMEVYARSYPGPGEARQISTDGGRYPVWSHQGNELYYLAGEQWNRWMVADIELEPTLVTATPKFLFEKDYDAARLAEFDVARDGQRFLVVEPMEEFASHQVRIVLNWFQELNRLVPVK